jgi:hypothetical protein
MDESISHKRVSEHHTRIERETDFPFGKLSNTLSDQEISKIAVRNDAPCRHTKYARMLGKIDSVGNDGGGCIGHGGALPENSNGIRNA